MIAVVGFGKFPIYFSDEGRLLGAAVKDEEFVDYVSRISGCGKRLVAILKVPLLKLRRVAVLRREAVNPQSFDVYQVPDLVFVYPDERGIAVERGVLSRGFVLGKGRRAVFVPMSVERYLLPEEVKALSRLAIPKGKREVPLDEIIKLLSEMGVEVRRRYRISEYEVLELFDGVASMQYYVAMRGDSVVDTNLCAEFVGKISLLEFVLLAREYRPPAYDPDSYPWYVAG